MFRTLISRLSGSSTGGRKKHQFRVALQLDVMEERIVPATIGAARGAALAAQQIGSMGATTRTVQASLAQYQSGVNRVLANYDRQSAQIVARYNARMTQLTSQFQAGVTSAAAAWEGQLSRQFVPAPGGGGTSTIGNPTPPVTGTNPPPEFTQPITRGATAGAVSTAAADGATTLPPEFSVPITRTLTTQIARAQQQANADLARLGQQTLASVNGVTGRFSSLGSSFSTASAGLTDALSARIRSSNAAFSQLTGLQAGLFSSTANSFRTLNRQLTTTTLPGTIDSFRSGLGEINDRFRTNLGNLGSDFNATTTTTSSTFGSALGQLNDRFNSGLRDDFAINNNPNPVFDNSRFF